MRISASILFVVIVGLMLSACEFQINPELEQAERVLVVDAWITNKPEPQEIILTWTQPYLQQTLPSGVVGAVVQITDDTGLNYVFQEDVNNEGVYRWSPTLPGEVFGKVGGRYTLSIQKDGETFGSFSEMNRTSPVDSITFEFEEESSFFPATYFAEFWSRDSLGSGDTYWIRAFKNGNLLNKPNEINVAFDAGFSEGGGFDGIIFIPPLRFGVNPFDQDANGASLPSYVIGDSLYVEIYSITKAAFSFLNEVRVQTDRPGGFAELFASPLSNVSTNLQNTNASGTKVIGFFCTSAAEGLGKKLED